MSHASFESVCLPSARPVPEDLVLLSHEGSLLVRCLPGGAFFLPTAVSLGGAFFARLAQGAGETGTPAARAEGALRCLRAGAALVGGPPPSLRLLRRAHA